MRQYRGLTKEGKWVYGWYVERNGHATIYPSDPYQKGHYAVIPDTVGQQTGLKDKNGKESFAGDEVYVKDGDYEAKGIVEWSNESGLWVWRATETHNSMTIATGQGIPLWKILGKQYRYQGVIIGNIHQTKEQDNA